MIILTVGTGSRPSTAFNLSVPIRSENPYSSPCKWHDIEYWWLKKRTWKKSHRRLGMTNTVTLWQRPYNIKSLSSLFSVFKSKSPTISYQISFKLKFSYPNWIFDRLDSGNMVIYCWSKSKWRQIFWTSL